MSDGDKRRESSRRLAAVYGYVRAEDADDRTVAALRQELGRFCKTNGLHLVTVCFDRDSDGSEIARPGFAAVLDALALPDSVALVVPDLNHLSHAEVVREALVRSVRRTGAKVLVAHQADIDGHEVAALRTDTHREDDGTQDNRDTDQEAST
jgi:resolvase-like protein